MASRILKPGFLLMELLVSILMLATFSIILSGYWVNITQQVARAHHNLHTVTQVAQISDAIQSNLEYTHFLLDKNGSTTVIGKKDLLPVKIIRGQAIIEGKIKDSIAFLPISMDGHNSKNNEIIAWAWQEDG